MQLLVRTIHIILMMENKRINSEWKIATTYLLALAPDYIFPLRNALRVLHFWMPANRLSNSVVIFFERSIYRTQTHPYADCFFRVLGNFDFTSLIFMHICSVIIKNKIKTIFLRLSRKSNHLQKAWTFLVEARALNINDPSIDFEESRYLFQKVWICLY